MNNYVELSIRLDYQTSSSLGGADDCSDYIQTINTDIIGEGDPREGDGALYETVLGNLQLYLIGVGNAVNDGIRLYDLFDTRQETMDAACVLFDSSLHEFQPAVTKLFPDAFSSDDILLLNRLTIDPAFRGQRLGLAVLHRAIQDWWSGCSLVVMKPFPLQFECDAQKRKSWTELKLDSFPQQQPTATKQLAAYYRRLGFERIGRSKFYALYAHYSLPSTDKLKLPSLISVDRAVFEKFAKVPPPTKS